MGARGERVSGPSKPCVARRAWGSLCRSFGVWEEAALELGQLWCWAALALSLTLVVWLSSG